MPPLSVTQFVEYLNAALAAAVFPEGVTIEGEVVEYRVSQGKWIWFSLKDDASTVQCFSQVWQMRQPLEDGMTVRVFGHPKVFGRSGKFSINVERASPVGEGALKRAYELLKARLTEEGIFAAQRKRPLPLFPRRIGLIASGGSAAYGDFLRILNQRWRGLEINHYDVQVQGVGAEEQVAAAFDWFNRHPDLADVIVLTRGGGSLEDLAAFNTEVVARAVFGSVKPVIVGVGHERDESLADWAADVRAATPTHAAELVVPNRDDALADIGRQTDQLDWSVAEIFAQRRSVIEKAVGTDDYHLYQLMSHQRESLSRSVATLSNFGQEVSRLLATVDENGRRVMAAWREFSRRTADKLASVERLISNLDPGRQLRRGYAIVRCGQRLLKSAAQVDEGDRIAIQLAQGSLAADVVAKSEELN